MITMSRTPSRNQYNLKNSTILNVKCYIYSTHRHINIIVSLFRVQKLFSPSLPGIRNPLLSIINISWVSTIKHYRIVMYGKWTKFRSKVVCFAIVCHFHWLKTNTLANYGICTLRMCDVLWY